MKAVKISVHNGFKHISGSSVGSRTPRSQMSTRAPSERGGGDEEGEEESVGEGSSDGAGGEWKGKEKVEVEAEEDVGGEE